VGILILSLNYAPEPTGFAPHTTALAEHLVTAGHQVTVVTGFPFAPRWARWSEFRGELVRHETVNGVQLVRITHFIPRKPGRALQRMLMEGSFAAAAGLSILLTRIRTIRRYDLVIYVGAQPVIAWLARIIAAVWRVPYIVKITDLAAQAAIDVGIVGDGTLATALKRFEFSGYRRASAAIVLCDAFKTALNADGFPLDSIHIIRDSVDLKAFTATNDRTAFRERHQIGQDEFVVLYSGSLGLKQGLLDVVEAAKLLAAVHPDVRWVIVGEGEMRDAVAARIASAGIGNRVILLPLQPEVSLGEMFAAADLLLLSQLKSVKDTVIPSKLMMYMAAGRPTLAAVNASSQAAEMIRDCGGGGVIAAEDPHALMNAVLDLRHRPSDRDVMARRAREYAERHFDRDAIVVAQQRVIEGVIGRHTDGAVRAAAATQQKSNGLS
jgi:colanic acid biosynthesis glycosyl transferase WcaI